MTNQSSIHIWTILHIQIKLKLLKIYEKDGHMLQIFLNQQSMYCKKEDLLETYRPRSVYTSDLWMELNDIPLLHARFHVLWFYGTEITLTKINK